MGVEQVALIPKCAECGEVLLPADDGRWRPYLDTDDELVFSEVADAESKAPSSADPGHSRWVPPVAP